MPSAAHVVFGNVQNLSPCKIGLSWLNPTPRIITVYALRPHHLRHRNTRYQAGATHYRDLTRTGCITSASPDARTSAATEPGVRRVPKAPIPIKKFPATDASMAKRLLASFGSEAEYDS